LPASPTATNEPASPTGDGEAVPTSSQRPPGYDDVDLEALDLGAGGEKNRKAKIKGFVTKLIEEDYLRFKFQKKINVLKKGMDK